MRDLVIFPGGGTTSVFGAGVSPHAGVRADRRVFRLAERLRVLPAATSQPQRDQQNPCAQAVAYHQTAYSGMLTHTGYS